MENTTTTTTTNLLADQLLQLKMDAFKQEFAEMISTLSKMMPSSKEPTNTNPTTTTTPDEPMVEDVLIEKKSEEQIISKDDKETEPKSSSSSSSSVNSDSKQVQTDNVAKLVPYELQNSFPKVDVNQVTSDSALYLSLKSKFYSNRYHHSSGHTIYPQFDFHLSYYTQNLDPQTRSILIRKTRETLLVKLHKKFPTPSQKEFSQLILSQSLCQVAYILDQIDVSLMYGKNCQCQQKSKETSREYLVQSLKKMVGMAFELELQIIQKFDGQID